MLFLKLLQQLVKALNSDGTPGQVAAGIALGAVFGLTPLMNLHNLVLFGLALILNVSMPGVFLGWMVFIPASFDVSSNIGGAVSRALGQAVAAEVRRAESLVRAKVDSLVGQQVSAARTRLAALDTGPLKSLTDNSTQLDAVQAQLEQRLKGLVPGIPGFRP
jgi:hypothetical protein